MTVRQVQGSNGPEARYVRDVRPDDLARTAELHVRELSDGLFPRLGARFMRSYHATFLDSPHAVSLVVIAEGRMQGFLLAVVDPAAHGRLVLRRSGLRLLLVGASALTVRPRLLVEFLRTRIRRYARALWRRRNSAPGVGSSAATVSVLSHVAVEPDRRGRGDGRALVDMLHTRLLGTAVSGVVLVTAHDGPGPGFYERIGYTPDGQLTGTDGERWVRYRRPM